MDIPLIWQAGPTPHTMTRYHVADTASNIRRLRKDRGWTLADLDYRCDFAAGTIRNYEQGIHRPAADHLYSLARALNVSADTILGLDDDVHED